MAFGARLGGVDRLLQRLVVRDPQGGGGGVERRTPMPHRASGQFPPGDEPPSRGAGIGPRPAQMERVAQSRFILGAAGVQDAGGGGAERQPMTPAQGGFSRTTASSRASAAPARNAASAPLSGAFAARAQPGNDAGGDDGRLWIPNESARSSMAKGYPTAALSPSGAAETAAGVDKIRRPIRLYYRTSYAL